MATPVLYGFLTDDSVRRITPLGTPAGTDQGYGQLSGETENYFVEPGIINDVRKARSMLVENQAPSGRMCIHYDKLRFDTDKLAGLTDVEHIKIFNIIERLYLQQEYADTNIEHMLTQNTIYGGYVSRTMAHSVNAASVTVENVKQYTKMCNIYDWIEFCYDSSVGMIKFHIWIGHQAFRQDYPYTTITNVIPPYDPNILVNPIQLLQSTNVGVLLSGSQYIFKDTNLELIARDQNGVYTYNTKYIVDTGRSILLPFALPYCGPRVPNGLECRKAIRNYLESNVEVDQSIIQALFPEIYVDSRFFIIPMWDMFQMEADRDVYPSIANLQQLLDTSYLIFPDTDREFLHLHMEIIMNSQNKMFSISMPDELNSKNFSLRQLHPTYQDYSIHTAAGFRFMTAETQEFAGKLSKCFAILNGEATSAEFIRTLVGDSYYLAFTSGKSEYMVLEKDSYMTILNRVVR